MPVYRIVEVRSQSLYYEVEAASEEEAVRLVEDGKVDLEPVDIGELDKFVRACVYKSS